MTTFDKRGRPNAIGRMIDTLAGRTFGLRSAACSNAIDRGIRIPMRDGIELAADHSRLELAPY